MMVTMLGSDIKQSDVYMGGLIDDIWNPIKEIGGTVRTWLPGYTPPVSDSVAEANIAAQVEQKRLQTYTILGVSAVAVIALVAVTKNKKRRR